MRGSWLISILIIAGAFQHAAADRPTLATTRTDGGWMILDITSLEGGALAIGPQQPGPHVIAFIVLNDDGTPRKSAMRLQTDTTTWTSVAVAGVAEESTPRIDTSATPGGLIGPFGEGTYRLLAWWVGSSRGWTIDADAGEGGSVTIVAEGSRSWFSYGEDFSGGHRVAVNTPAARVEAVQLSTRTITAAGTFVGLIGDDPSRDFDVGHDTITLEPPGGQRKDCPCAFFSIGTQAPGAGDYRITREATSVEGLGRNLVLAGVDVTYSN